MWADSVLILSSFFFFFLIEDNLMSCWGLEMCHTLNHPTCSIAFVFYFIYIKLLHLLTNDVTHIHNSAMNDWIHDYAWLWLNKYSKSFAFQCWHYFSVNPTISIIFLQDVKKIKQHSKLINLENCTTKFDARRSEAYIALALNFIDCLIGCCGFGTGTKWLLYFFLYDELNNPNPNSIFYS